MKIFLLLILIYLISGGTRFYLLIQKGVMGAKEAENRLFERLIPGAKQRFLFAGDSTIVGTGVTKPADSTPGRFGTAFPNAEIINLGRNGKLLEELLKEILEKRTSLGHFDLIVFQIGGNDITHRTPFADMDRDIRALVEIGKNLSTYVVVLHTGNLGRSPIFPKPIGWYFTWRTKHVREIYQRVAKETGAVYVDLYAAEVDELFRTDRPRYYMNDLFHPSGEGYRIWYENTRKALDEAGVRLQ